MQTKNRDGRHLRAVGEEEVILETEELEREELPHDSFERFDGLMERVRSFWDYSVLRYAFKIILVCLLLALAGNFVGGPLWAYFQSPKETKMLTLGAAGCEMALKSGLNLTGAEKADNGSVRRCEIVVAEAIFAPGSVEVKAENGKYVTFVPWAVVGLTNQAAKDTKQPVATTPRK